MALIFSGNNLLGGGFAPTGSHRFTLVVLGVSAAAALSGFVAHEMAHKVAAQRRGYWAEFRASPYGLMMALVSSYIGFILAAPGATMVGGMSEVEARNWGRTSLAGPMTNAVFSAAFYAASIGAFLLGSSLTLWLLVLAFINGWFGTFNLFPFGLLDGRKVYRWSPGVWAASIALTSAATIVSMLALNVYASPFLGF